MNPNQSAAEKQSAEEEKKNGKSSILKLVGNVADRLKKDEFGIVDNKKQAAEIDEEIAKLNKKLEAFDKDKKDIEGQITRKRHVFIFSDKEGE